MIARRTRSSIKIVPPFPIPKTMPKFAANLHYLFSEVVPAK